MTEASRDNAVCLPESPYLRLEWFANCIEQWTGQASFELLCLHADRKCYALVGKADRVRHGWVRSRVLALNESMDEQLDEVVIELNGFFAAHSTSFAAAFEDLLARLLLRPNWDELRVGGVISARAEVVRRLAEKYTLEVHVHADKPTYWVDLDHIRAVANGNYLATRSANCRQQLRRALRALESKHGKVVVDVAATEDEALEIFEQIGPLHRARWAATRQSGKYGGFDNPKFVAFHRQYIRRAFGIGGIQMFRVLAGSTMVAGLYNFIANRSAYFYLGGVNYQAGEQFKPGMLAHWLAIEHNLAHAMSTYDFLAGENRYKASLSTNSDRQFWLMLQRPRLVLRLEALARVLKHRLEGARGPSGF